MLTQQILKKYFNYNKDTGDFNWISSGKRAGCISESRLGSSKYIKIGLFGKSYLAHRMAVIYVIGDITFDQVDHINGNGTDNRFINLRIVSSIENSRNQKLSIRNKSGLCGVSWCNTENKWVSQISLKNKHIALGRFSTIFDAAAARKRAEIQLGFHANHGKDRSVLRIDELNKAG